MFEFRSDGRRVSQGEFFENLKREVIEAGMRQLERRVHAAAASIVDPETGQHAEVFVRRRGASELTLQTRGSAAFTRELEKRLGLEIDSIQTMSPQAANESPRVYLAHASEDHETLARPLAERLMANGIEVWLDEWEIRAGDSLRRKMEEGLSNCTHFVVILTSNSLPKPWVQTEIDAGFVRAVGGESRFIGVRAGIGLKELSPFLQTLRCPELRLDQPNEVDALIADIHGVSRKPERGEAPCYIKAVPEGLKAWSPAAIAVAEHLVRTSDLGRKFDPQVTTASVSHVTALPEEDVRIGVLDLVDCGLVERSMEIGSERFWPTDSLFVEFDRHFLDFDNRHDGVAIANWLVSQKIESIDIAKLATQFSDWPPRRLNGALNYLDEAKVIHPFKPINSGPWTMGFLRVTDYTRRFVRDHG